MTLVIVAATIGALGVMLFIFQYAASRSRRAVTERLDEITGIDQVSAAQTEFVLQRRGERFQALADVFRGKAFFRGIERQLTAAGLLLKPTEFVVVQGLSVMFGLGIGLLLVQNVVYAVIFTFLGYMVPKWVLGFLVGRRKTALEAQLADALTMVGSGLKGGYSFVQGLQMAAEQLPPPISEEFDRVLHLIQLGIDAPKALRRMEERVQSYDFSMAVNGVVIQLGTGGNLSELLERIALTIRDRIKLRRDIKAATAEGVMSAFVLVSLPACIAALLFVINPDYAHLLFSAPVDPTEFPLGKWLVRAWLVMQLVGIFWIRKLLDFDA